MTVIQKIISGKPLPNLCRNCKYFMPDKSYLFNSKSKVEFGKCTYEQKIDLVTGDVSYDYASIVREFTCKGEFYKEK